MSTQHTPGPWTVGTDDDTPNIIVEDENGYIISEVRNDGDDKPEQRANAHLIAAAPAIYEALQQSLVLVELAALEEWGRAVRGEQQPPTTEAKDRLEKVKAALAQAEGK